MLCMPLSFRIFSLLALVTALEACVSTSCIDSGVRSWKVPKILWRSCCETRHFGHGWLADAARQPQKYAASSASCDSIRMPGYSTRLMPSAQRWASPFCERCFKLRNTFFKTFWYTSLLKCANSSFSAAERLVGSNGSSICIHVPCVKISFGQVRKTYNRHVSKQHSTTISRSISYLAWKPSRSQQHRVFLHASRNQSLVKPEMEWNVGVGEDVTTWKFRLENKIR